MDRNEAVTGAPGTIDLGGQTYLVAQPTDEDFATLRSHLKAKLDSPLKAIADDLKYLAPADRAEAIKAAVALKTGGGAELTPQYVQEQLMQPPGAAFLAWLLVRRNHPDVKLDDVKAAVTGDNVLAVLADLKRASGMEAAAGGKVGGATGSAPGAGPTAPASTPRPSARPAAR